MFRKKTLCQKDFWKGVLPLVSTFWLYLKHKIVFSLNWTQSACWENSLDYFLHWAVVNYKLQRLKYRNILFFCFLRVASLYFNFGFCKHEVSCIFGITVLCFHLVVVSITFALVIHWGTMLMTHVKSGCTIA